MVFLFPRASWSFTCRCSSLTLSIQYFLLLLLQLLLQGLHGHFTLVETRLIKEKTCLTVKTKHKVLRVQRISEKRSVTD